MIYRLILFDFDGTLCHTRAADIHIIQKAYAQLNQPGPTRFKIELAIQQGLMTQAMFEYLSPEADANFIQELLAIYKQSYLTQQEIGMQLFPGAVQLLQHLSQTYALVVVSNKAADLLESAVIDLGLASFFSLVVGTELGKPFKPDPKVYDHLIVPSFSDILPCDTLMIGDTATDLRFAKAVGVDACWASYGEGDAVMCQTLAPKYTLHKLSDLHDILV